MAEAPDPAAVAEFKRRMLALMAGKGLTRADLVARGIPSNTYGDVFNKALPPSPVFLRRFLEACEVTGQAEIDHWLSDHEALREGRPLSLLPDPSEGPLADGPAHIQVGSPRPGGVVGRVVPAGLRRRWLIVAVAGVVVLAAAGTWPAWRWDQPNSAGSADSARARARALHCNTDNAALTRNGDGECLGLSADGGDLFNDPSTVTGADRDTIEKINAVQMRIHALNQEIKPTDRYVKVTALTSFTVARARPPAVPLKLIQHSLEGIYTALDRINHSADFGDPTAEKIQLSLVNIGSLQEASDQVISQTLALSQPGHPLVAAVGMSISVPNSLSIAQRLAAHHIPIVTASTSADDFTTIKGLWNVTPGNHQYAQALRAFLDHPDQKTLKNGIIVYDSNSDLYTKSLRAAFHDELGPYIKFPDQPFVGSTIDTKAAPDVFNPVVTNLCTAADDIQTPLDMVFWLFAADRIL